MKLSKNQEIKIHSDTNWKIQLILMKAQVQCFLQNYHWNKKKTRNAWVIKIDYDST